MPLFKKGLPFIYGGVNKFDGMMTTFIPGKTPCFECLFPGIESPKSIIGVIGPLPGVVGSLQAMEAIKIVLGHGRPADRETAFYLCERYDIQGDQSGKKF